MPDSLRDLVLPDIVADGDLARVFRCSRAEAVELFESGVIPGRFLFGRWVASREAVIAALEVSAGPPRLLRPEDRGAEKRSGPSSHPQSAEARKETKMESAAGFAREQGVSPERVRTLAAEHGLGEKVGGVWAFDEDDVEALEELLEEEDDDPDDEEEDDE